MIRSQFTSMLCLASLAGILSAHAAEPRNPLIPMGAITGSPDETVVRETLEAYKSVGIDQYLIYPRSGLELEYMSEEWLQVCEWFCQHAKRLNMKIWLYDEYNWPSGSCQNRVQSGNPAFQHAETVIRRKPDKTFDWSLVRSPERVNLYEPAAVQRFIELTHRVYEQRLRPYLGSTVIGIFTDEPGYPARVDAPGATLKFRTFTGLEKAYREATGRAFRADVERFLNDPSQDAVWGIYAELQGRQFRASYFDPIREWADRVGLLTTGHLMDEHHPTRSTLYNGNAPHVLQGLSLPGMDEVFTKGLSQDPDWSYSLSHARSGQIEWLTLATLQHAALRRQNGGLAELFAVGPCDMTLTRQRQMIWLTALHGVDRYLLAIAPLDVRGLVEKSNYYNDFTPTQPWFPCLQILGDEAKRAAAVARRIPVRDVAVRFPLHQIGRARMNPNRALPPLVELLHRLAMAQLTWELVADGEPCDLPHILEFGENGALTETRSGRRFTAPVQAVAFLHDAVAARTRVITADGTPAADLCLRRYEDGLVAVLNLTADARPGLRLCGSGRDTVPFDLPPRGIFLHERKTDPVPAPLETLKHSQALPSGTLYALTLSGANTVRVVFTGQVARVTVKTPLEGVRLVVRQHPQAVTLRHNGDAVQADQACDTLPQGFRPLYSQSAPLRLAVGEHRFELSGDAKDSLFFLPALWIAGSIATDGTRALVACPALSPAQSFSAAGLADFAGAATYAVRVAIPPQARFLRCETGDLCASVALDAENLGSRAWAPFVWPIPDRLRGREAELRITLHTSVAPIFGDAQTPGAQWKQLWLPMTPQGERTGLLSAPEWCW